MKGVLITGASGGIGRALCAAFRSGGWRVVATDAPERGTPDGSGTEGMIWVPCCLAAYVADAGVRDGFRTRVVEALGDVPLVALVNNAAVQHCGATPEVVPSEWESTLAVNVSAPFFLVQSFLGLLEKSRGSVVQITSIHASQTKPGFVAYATSKAALAGLTRALAVDLGGVCGSMPLRQRPFQRRCSRPDLRGERSRARSWIASTRQGVSGNPTRWRARPCGWLQRMPGF